MQVAWWFASQRPNTTQNSVVWSISEPNTMQNRVVWGTSEAHNPSHLPALSMWEHSLDLRCKHLQFLE